MYTDIKTILDDANKNNYAVLAASAFNMELARGLIAAADEMQAPLIILMGQAQMTKHARPELMVPMIKTLAEQTNVPVALILDHGRDWEKITWAYRQGFSSIMVDASAYDMEENIATEIFNACRDYAKNRLDEKPDLDYMSLMMEVEQECKKTVKHFISLTGSEGKAAGFKKKYAFCHGISQIDTGIGE